MMIIQRAVAAVIYLCALCSVAAWFRSLMIMRWSVSSLCQHGCISSYSSISSSWSRIPDRRKYVWAAELRQDRVQRGPGAGLSSRVGVPRRRWPTRGADGARSGRTTGNPPLRAVLAAARRSTPVRDAVSRPRRTLGLALPHAGAVLLWVRRDAARRPRRRSSSPVTQRPGEGSQESKVVMDRGLPARTFRRGPVFCDRQ